ncbi:hypothetical protein [Azospirillum brasilense]|uniref:hypothetical protein n=1 Tax=Azospirillum brasilense TaxID=192 RepID=UPI000E680972|nr:hypothetical protein [Azospirillum brasilense]NUB24656.1 hypothetical protein [Azospirillum brasilense]NUB35165.1 hypothetical protein [Azospirillum brasilense]RIW07705.1 hypothetical protein D2T81_02385 [Azospirillum brasilense]
MRDVPIIFSAPMVRALLDGRKTQTRRLASSPLAKVQPGDRLWVRENARVSYEGGIGDAATHQVEYQACGPSPLRSGPAPSWFPSRSHNNDGSMRWCPSIHMPRWASRITLVVEQVRVERLQDITREDVYAEGAITDEWLQWREDAGNIGMPEGSSIEDERDVFARLWTSLHSTDAWAANPWVVALTFAVHRSNIDKLEAREVADA